MAYLTVNLSDLGAEHADRVATLLTRLADGDTVSLGEFGTPVEVAHADVDAAVLGQIAGALQEFSGL